MSSSHNSVFVTQRFVYCLRSVHTCRFIVIVLLVLECCADVVGDCSMIACGKCCFLPHTLEKADSLF